MSATVLASDLTKTIGVVSGEPDRVEEVNKVEIIIEYGKESVVVVNDEWYYRTDLVEALMMVYSAFKGGPRSVIECLDNAIYWGDLVLLWFNSQPDPLLGFEISGDVYVVIVPLDKADNNN